MNTSMGVFTMRRSDSRYIVGLITPHGILRLDTGRRYGRIAASLRAEELETTAKAEKEALEGIRFIALALDSE
jgi:hypothetical protein